MRENGSFANIWMNYMAIELPEQGEDFFANDATLRARQMLNARCG